MKNKQIIRSHRHDYAVIFSDSLSVWPIKFVIWIIQILGPKKSRERSTKEYLP